MTEQAQEAAAPAPVERERQNGFTRPLPGTKTGRVWDIADKISADKGSPALRDEVMAEYKKQVPDASDGTISTQYSRWCGFHAVQDVLRKQRAEAKAAEAKAKEEAKAEKAKAKAAEKEAKAQAAAEKKAAAAKAKEEKAAAAAAKKKAADEAKAAAEADAPEGAG